MSYHAMTSFYFLQDNVLYQLLANDLTEEKIDDLKYTLLNGLED